MNTQLILNEAPECCFYARGVSRDGSTETVHIPVIRGYMDMLPDGIEALLVTSDLQAREKLGRHCTTEPRLVGQRLAEELSVWLKSTYSIPTESMGVILAGDFWAYPPSIDKRGGYGDVRPVYNAFADHFGMVLGVPGNHDLFEAAPSNPAVCASWRHNVVLIDCGIYEWGGIRVGGVGGCVGNPKRPFRYESDAQLNRVLTVAGESCDLLVLHQGPPGDGRTRAGAREVQSVLEMLPEPTVVMCGHEHWQTRLHQVGGAQVLNVHESVVLLTRPCTEL